MTRFSGKRWLQKVILFVICFFLICVSPVPAATKKAVKTIEITGTSIIYNEDIAAAREKAIANGLVSGVGIALSEVLPSDYITQNFETLNITILQNKELFILDYKVLAESSHKKIHRVMIKINVSLNRIKAKLLTAGLMLGKKPMPRTLVLIAEKNIEDTTPVYWWGKGMFYAENAAESAIAEKMMEKGFVFVNHRERAKSLDLTKYENKPILDDQDIIDLGTRLQANIVIIGKSIAGTAQNTMGTEIKSFEGIVKTRVIRLDKQIEIASDMQSVITANADDILGSTDALVKAGHLAGTSLAEKIVAAWNKESNKSTIIKIIVGGNNYFANFVKFRKKMAGIPNIKDVITKELKSDEATLIIAFEGTAKELAEQLMLKTFDSFGINIYEATEEILRIELVQR